MLRYFFCCDVSVERDSLGHCKKAFCVHLSIFAMLKCQEY